MYVKQIIQWRIYASRKNLGYELKNCRDEYGKELIIVYLKYKWKSDSEIDKLIEITKGTKLGVWRRICKCFKGKIEEEIKTIINKEKEKRDISKVLKQIQEQLNKYYFKKWKDKKHQ